MSDLNRSLYIAHDLLAGCTLYFDGPNRYLEHDLARGPKALEISGGVLFADESGEYYIEGACFEQLLTNPQILNTRVPV